MTKTTAIGNEKQELPIIGKGLKITPLPAYKFLPFDVEGDVTSSAVDGVTYYYCAGRSFPASIAEVINDEL